MSTKLVDQVQVDVDFGSADIIGSFANAFRVTKDTGDEFFLDFLAFSASEKKARMVVRLRVHKTLIPAIRERLDNTLKELIVAENRAQFTLVPSSENPPGDVPGD